MSAVPSRPTSSRLSARADGVDPDDGTLSEVSAGDAIGDVLSKSVIRRGLSDIQKTADRKNYAFTRLEMVGQNIKTLEGEIAAYPELRYVNLSSNELLDLSPLSVLPSLLSLQVSNNHLSSLNTFLATPHPHLQLLQVDRNELETLLCEIPVPGKKAPGSALSINFPSLFALTLSNNKLTSLARPEDNPATFTNKNGHPTLQVLDVAFNQLSTLVGVSAFPELRILNLQSNELDRLDGIESLVHLEKLNVSSNRLVNFSSQLTRLARLPKLTHLVISTNPGLTEELETALAAAQAAGTATESQVANGIDMVAEILLVLPNLLFIDGRRVTANMRRTADALKKERDLDADRRASEEAGAKKAAAEEDDPDHKKANGDEDEDGLAHHSNDENEHEGGDSEHEGDMMDGGDMDQDDE